ncbi:Bug family tripartite tricarboxylate transporter substrate binding protein [Azohydromonas aeria]|uniref:Bug family tripartite tricarboxylate transporter substrate binding protein n=1 Tax=Azohydromonas aeria TaxID=2590212 RepID=UPI0012F8042D|nr:tripartite tricarboxylate transporter substrate binding protein [Azohydromonas aeria]
MSHDDSFSRARRALSLGLPGAFALGVLGALPARAQSWPSKPIRLVVPFPPGGATDVVARALGERLHARLGQPVVIDNKPGASTLIGADAVAKAPGDGHVLLLSGSSTYSVVPALKSQLPYDPKKDLALVAMVARAPLVLVAGPATPVKSLAELIALAKAKPGEVTYPTFGPGSAPHLAGERFSAEAGVKLLPIPYKGSAAAALAVVGGEIAMAFDTIASAAPHIKAGKLRALAVVDSARSSLLPDVPTLAELKYPKATFEAWYGVAAPGATPAAVQQALARELAAVLVLPEVKEKLLAAGLEPQFSDAAAFAAKVQAETAAYAALGKRVGISMD